MLTNLFIGRDALLDFTVSVTGTALLIPVLFWLFFGEREYRVKNKISRDDLGKTTDILFWLILLSLGILIAPGSSLMIQKMIGSVPYIDTMIMIPTAMITVYAFIHLMRRLHVTEKKRRIGAVICLSALIVISSSVFISYGHPLGFRLVSNPMKIDPETQEICEMVGSDYVLLPEEIYGQIGEFDSGVKAGSLHDITYDRYHAYHATVAAIEAQADLFVIRKAYDNPSAISPYYEKIAETDHYVIYQRSEE